jgi:hypothetical protein
MIAVYVAFVMYAMSRQSVYAVMLDEIAERSRKATGSRDLPDLAEWAIRNIKFTPAFLIGTVPLIAIAVSKETMPTTIRTAFVIGGIGIAGLAGWMLGLWLGLDFIFMKFGEVG